jgi:hypothetical protein
MNDATLQAALADLRPKYVLQFSAVQRIPPTHAIPLTSSHRLLAKFHAEDPNLTKKSMVEVHRGGKLFLTL